MNRTITFVLLLAVAACSPMQVAAGSKQAGENDKAAASEKVSEKAIHIVERFLATNKRYHLLGLSDVPKTVLEDERSGKSWASRGLKQADMLAFAVMEGDPNGDGVEDVVAIVVRGDNDHKLYSLICFNGRKGGGYIPTPFWVVKDSSHFIGNFYVVSAIYVIYDDLGSGGWVPDEDYSWNGSAYEEGYLFAGEHVCSSAGNKIFSLPTPTSKVVNVVKAEGAELLILSAVQVKVGGVRWYKVQVLRNNRRTRIVGFVSRVGLNPDC
ncbi:MAG TPA: hypothetical protein VNO24_29325 [Blastocatellia bacterium]|nr:hypothetical protein [Blastocatellia bacterium]